MLCLTIPHHNVVGVWQKFHPLVYPSALECTGDGPWQSEVERCTGKSRLQWQWHKDNDEKDADDCCIRTVSSILTWKPFPLLYVSEERVNSSANEISHNDILASPFALLISQRKGKGIWKRQYWQNCSCSLWLWQNANRSMWFRGDIPVPRF